MNEIIVKKFSIHYILNLLIDNFAYSLLLIPFYVAYEVVIFLININFLYKNNRSGYGSGHSKRYGDRFLEICSNKTGLSYGFSQKINKSYVFSGSSFSEQNIIISEIDDILLEKKFIIKKNNKLFLNNNLSNFKFITNNIILFSIKLICRFVYLDSKNYQS